MTERVPDWGRFGLSPDETVLTAPADKPVDIHTTAESNELFTENEASAGLPWWKLNFFVSEPVLFGTWDGVFTSCMINIFGVVIFLRTGWMVGNAGLGLAILIILLTIGVALVAALSAVGVCERCDMQSGGVYFLLSHVLGARAGASVAILYCFGQAVACSLYVVGFGESLASLFHQESIWVARGIGAGIIILLLGINIAGVKWVIRLQLLLLLILLVAVCDFLLGSFIHHDPGGEVVGFSSAVLANNTGPSYQDGETFFTVFGVFFPTATGVFAGINMSGDLRQPSRSIPVGTLSAVGVSTLLYVMFAVVLGSTCSREGLQQDYMIAEKVSIVGVLFLAGLYISSVSSSMGGLFGSPRILQCIAAENVIPVVKGLAQGVSLLRWPWLVGVTIILLSSALGCVSGSPKVLQAIGADHVVWVLEPLAKGRGANKVPVFALLVITVTSLIFVFIGKVNTLGPIVTMPFMLTYAAVDYAYFALAMSFDKQKSTHTRYRSSSYGSLGRKHDDLDTLFEERAETGPDSAADTTDQLGSPTFIKDVEQTEEDTDELLTKSASQESASEIRQQPRSFYSAFSNRWLSLLGMVLSLVIMFAIQWGYALANISVMIAIYIYIGQANPGVSPGISEFHLYEWLLSAVKSLRRTPALKKEMIVTPATPAMKTTAAQLTEDSDDFADRGRYHQSEVVKGDNFDDYNSE